MTRREFLPVAAAGMAWQPPVSLPVRVLVDARAKLAPQRLARAWPPLWNEAIRDLAAGGIRLVESAGACDIERPPGREPIVLGLGRGALNVVVTHHIPMEWDSGRTLCGATTLYRGFHLCMIALDHAHRHQIPFVSLNTCLHEMLHALLLDIFEERPPGAHGQYRELRVDCFGTRLWLLHDGAAVRRYARQYVERLTV